MSVHDWLERYLLAQTHSEAIILKDHATGEIADFVVVEGDTSIVTFFHCKGARTTATTATIADLKVLEQVVRTVGWIRRADLLTEILSRVNSDARPNSRLVKGRPEAIEALVGDFRPALWDYKVALVQPGLNGAEAVRRSNTNTLLLNAYEWLRELGSSLLILSQ